MNENLKNICLFASASNNIDDIYHKDATKIGELLAQNGYNIIFGGSDLGLMGKVTEAAYNLGSKITGVMPQKLYNLGINPGRCHDFIITKGMRERKAKMDELSDGIIALAGGFGTLEEVSEMLTQKQLDYNNKPIIFLNTNNFYNELILFFEKIIEEKFATNDSKRLFFVADTPCDAINYLKNYNSENIDYLSQKINLKNQSKV